MHGSVRASRKKTLQHPGPTVRAREVEEELQDDPAIDAGAEIVDDDAGTFGKFFEEADRRRFEDVEKAEEEEADEHGHEVHGRGDEGDKLSGNFINDDVRGIFAAAATGFEGGGGDPNGDGERSQGENDVKLVRSGDEVCNERPKQYGGCCAPGARAGLAETRAKENGDEVCPARVGVVDLVRLS